MITIPVVRGKLGTTEYFQTKMKAGDLIANVGFVSESPECDEITADDKLQRDLNIPRVVTEIVPYITEDPDRFFGSLVVDIYMGWKEVEFDPLEDVVGKVPKAYQAAVKDFGFITLPGNQVLIALDGQHRLLGLRVAIKGKMGLPANTDIKAAWEKYLVPHPELANEEISVIFVKHENTIKIRKIFNKINKYAKQTSKSDNIIISEDDVYAIIARRIMGEGGPLAPLKDGENYVELVNWKNNTLAQRSAQLTTLSSIYTMAESLLKDRDINSSVLPDREEIEECYMETEEFWNILLEQIDAYKEYMEHSLERNMGSELRKDNLLMKPVTQMALAHVALFAKEKGLEFTNVAAKLNEIDWSYSNKMWQNILVIGSSKPKIMAGKDSIRNAAAIIEYLTMGSKMTAKERESVLEIIRNATADENATLPKVI